MITVSDGTVTKTHQVTSVDLTEIDLETDTMSGVADPFAVVNVEAWTDDSGAGRRVTADAAGNWIADFSYQPTEDDYDAGIWGSVDLQGNYGFGFYEMDDDVDNTGWEQPQGAPGMLAVPDLDVINIDATGLSPVTLTVESSGGELLYEDTFDVVRGGQAGDLGGFDFPDHYPFINSPIGYPGARVDLSGVLDLVPGQVITWSDMAYTVEMVVAELEVTEVDVDADVALGTMGSSASGVWGALQDFAAYGFTDPVGASEWTMSFCEAEAQLADEDCVPWDIIQDDLGLVLAYGDSGFRSYTGAVWDLRPVITELTFPTEPVETGTPVELSAVFADLEVPDSHTAAIDWGDGTAVEEVGVTAGARPGSGGTVTGTHIYATAGSYELTLMVIDGAGDTDSVTAPVGVLLNEPPISHDDEYFMTQGDTLVGQAGAQWYYNSELINSSGGGADPLQTPSAVTVDDAGNAYVTGFDSSNVFRVTPQGAVTLLIGPEGDGVQQLTGPTDVAVDPSGNLFVTGGRSHNLFRIAPDGTITLVPVDYGIGHPRSVAVAPDGIIYVAVFFSESNESMVFRTYPSLGSSGAFAGPFPGDIYPGGIATDGGGYLWVAAPEIDRLYRIAPSGGVHFFTDVPGACAIATFGETAYVATFQNQVWSVTADVVVAELMDQAGDGITPLLEPRSVGVDDSGAIYVTSHGSHSVFRLRPDGSAMRVMGVTANHLAVTPGGTLYVSDEDNDIFYRGGRSDGVLDNDWDSDGDPISAVLVDDVDHGTLTLNSDGSLVYTPDPDWSGTDSFTYVAHDAFVDSALATVTLTVESAGVGYWPLDDGDGSVASDASGRGHDGTVVGASWIDGLSSGALSFDGVDDVVAVPVHSDFYPADAVTVEAWVKLDQLPDAGSGGTILLNGRADGQTWSYHLNVTDDGRARWSIKTATSAIVAVVSDPALVSGRWYHLAGTYDSATLRLYVNGALVGETSATGGLYSPSRYPLTLGASYYFAELRNGIAGNLDEVAVHVRALEAGELVDNYTALANEPPVGVDDDYTVLEGSTLTVAAPGVLGNDTDPGTEPLIAELVDGAAHGTLTFTDDGSFTYQPDAGFVGDDTFTYAAIDIVGQSALETTATITVEPLNAAPTAVSDEYFVVRNTATAVAAPGVLGNDSDPNLDALSALLVTATEHGVVSLDPDGSFTYEPETGFEGTDSFTYVADDGEFQSEVATVSLVVHRPTVFSTSVYPPSSVYVPVSGVEGRSISAVARMYGGPPGRSTRAVVYLHRLRSDGVWRTVDAEAVWLRDGEACNVSFYYRFSGSDLYGVTWKTEVVVDGAPMAESSTARTSVRKDGSWDRRSWFSFRLWSPVDMLVTDPLGRRIGTTPDGEIVNEIPDATYSGPESEPEEVNIPDPLEGDYTVLLTATGTGDYTLVWSGVGDDEGEVVIQEIQGTVSAGDELTYDVDLDIPAVPVANDDAYSTDEDAPLTVDPAGVLDNDVDEDGDPLTAILVTGPEHGTLTFADDGSFTYTPNADWYGTDTFTYLADDGQFDSNEATVTIEVTAVNDPPVGIATPAERTVQYSDAMAPITIAVDDIDSMSVMATATGLPDGVILTGSPCDLPCDLMLSGTVTDGAGSYEAVVTLVDDGGATSDPPVTIIVEPEDASIAFHGGNPVAVRVESAGGESGTFNLMVRVREAEPDTALGSVWPGDINHADVAMQLAPVGPGSPAEPIGACERRLDGDGYDQELTVMCAFDEVPVNAYTLAVTVGGGFYAGDAEDIVVVYDPSLGYTTGGGSFLWPGTDEVVNFGYTMKYNKKGQKVKGSLLLIRHVADGSIYRVKSNALYGLALGEGDGFGWASFSGKSTYLDPTMPDPEGNHDFVVYVEDRNEPGDGVDRFWIEMHDKDNAVIPALSMDRGAADHAVPIEGGNLVVPHRAAKMK